MSQRMQCHRRQAIALDESRKPSGKRIRMDGLTVPSRKQSPAFVPLVAQLQTPLTLMDVVRFQHCGHTIGQFEHAPRGLVFGVIFKNTLTRYIQRRAGDGQQTRIKINVRPDKPAQLAPAQAGIQKQRNHDPIFFRGIFECFQQPRRLRFVKPFIMAMIGGGGGFLASLLGLRATGMSITGIPGTLLYLNEQLPFYILVNVVAFAVAFVLTYFFGFHSKMENQA